MINILFVCLGNICRSSAAEGMLQHLAQKEGMGSSIMVDSAGTCNYHVGELPDPRMREHSLKRGIKLHSRARQFDAAGDFEKFDYIIMMDDSNMSNVAELDSQNKYRDKMYKMTDFCVKSDHQAVPDPYYGGEQGFEVVLDLLEDANEQLLKKIKEEIE